MDAVSEKYNAVVVAKVSLTPDLFILKVKPDKAMPEFIPGQYVLLGISSNLPRRPGCAPEFKESKADRLILRAYSLASAGHEPGLLEFYVSVVSNGSLTPRLVNLNPGDRLMVGDKIRGFFTLDTVPKEHDTVVLAATGTGLAPYVSMMRRHAVKPYPFRFVLFHGAARSWELGYSEELRCHSRYLPRVTYLPSITRTKEDPWWTGETGRITQYFQSHLMRDRLEIDLDPARTSVFLCGNPEMIHEVGTMLEPLGYSAYTTSQPGSLHTEEYW
ncbi:MAG: oxidoreductase FAD/NAD(P)-binding domain protein [Fibrobacteres bacterium]|nr:oxidoreductase FAD/NAD(P)-binding domain protein [Fibrobacterota bacterium]